MDFKNIVNNVNTLGIPLPFFRDPLTQKASVPLTLVILSTILVTAGIVGKCARFLDGVDLSIAMQFFYASCSLYFGHSWINKDPKVDDVGKIR